MNLVACPRCGAQFDVSAFAPGSNFVCGACKNMLQVPAAVAPAAPRAAPKAAPKPAAASAPAPLAKKPATDRRRAGDAAPSQAAPTEGRAASLRARRTEAGGGAKKSPMPLIAAAVGGLLLVGGGLAFALSGKGGGTPEDGGNAAAGGSGAAGAQASNDGAAGGAAAAEPLKPKEKGWEDLTPAERLVVAEQKKKEALASPESVKEVHAWLLEKGYADDAKSYLVEARGRHPQDAWILGELGQVNRADDIRKIATDENMLFTVDAESPDLAFVTELHERVKKDKNAAWLSKEQSAKLDKAIEVLTAELARASDPVFQRTKQEMENIRLNPSFAGMQFAAESFRPYVIFAEASDRKDEADRVVQLTGKVMTFLYARWLKFMKEDLKLDPPTLESLKDDRLKIFVFKSRESFDAWHERQGGRAPQFAAAYYEHGRNRMIMMHLDSFDPGTIMHEGTHQLIHYYARYFCEQDDHAEAEKKGQPKERVEYDDRRLNSGFFWFQEGIAEYFGGAVKDKNIDGEWRIGALQGGRMAFFKMMLNAKKTWAVEDFLYADSSQIRTRAAGREGGQMSEELFGLMY
ncbi:MAG TPA: hypothetical protein VFS92_01520, partial [Planctomycetota bacterium]|nr:hypothetical protein [Planctomycetota bacterium]